MIGGWKSIYVFLSFLALAMAATMDCIVAELKDVIKTVNKLDDSVTKFHHCPEGLIKGHLRDIKPLTIIYSQATELDSQLEELISDIQCSSDFSAGDSQILFQELVNSMPAIMKVLDSFKVKHCDFEESLGPTLNHRVVGNTLKLTRCLTLDMLRSVESRIDDTYKEVISAAQAQIDATFQSVLSIY